MGVYFEKRSGKYVVRKYVNGKRVYHGKYLTEAMAKGVDRQLKADDELSKKLEEITQPEYNWKFPQSFFEPVEVKQTFWQKLTSRLK